MCVCFVYFFFFFFFFLLTLHVLQIKKIFQCWISSIRNIHWLERVYGIIRVTVFQNMHHLKTKEFSHRVRRKQRQRNQSARCRENCCCCCSAASAVCNCTVPRLLGCYRSHLPLVQVISTSLQPQIKKKTRNLQSQFSRFSSFHHLHRWLGLADNQPRGQVAWNDSRFMRDANFFPIFQYFTKVLLRTHFPTSSNYAA